MEKSIASDLYREVIAVLVGLRRTAGLTQRQLAAKLRREPSFIAKIELGERRVDILEFWRICRACKEVPSKAALRLFKRLDVTSRKKKPGARVAAAGLRRHRDSVAP